MRFLLGIALLLASSAAWAQTCRTTFPPDTDTGCVDQGQAYAAAAAAAADAKAKKDIPSQTYFFCPLAGGSNFAQFVIAINGCNSGINTTRITRYFPEGATCASRPEQTGWAGDSEFVCHDGCTYKGYRDPVVGVFFSTFDTAANKQLGVCSASATTPAPTPGGDDGGGTGSETGGGDEGGGGDGSGGGGDSGGGTGGETGGGDGGGGGDGDGDGDGDGGGDTGGGDGGGTQPGTGEGGEGGAPGPTTGRLYKKKGKTVDKVLAEFKDSIEGAPILSKVKGFFGDCPGGGSCPSATWDGGQYAGKFDLASLCGGVLLQLFQYAGFVFLSGMSIVALRWALL